MIQIHLDHALFYMTVILLENIDSQNQLQVSFIQLDIHTTIAIFPVCANPYVRDKRSVFRGNLDLIECEWCGRNIDHANSISVPIMDFTLQ